MVELRSDADYQPVVQYLDLHVRQVEETQWRILQLRIQAETSIEFVVNLGLNDFRQDRKLSVIFGDTDCTNLNCIVVVPVYVQV